MTKGPTYFIATFHEADLNDLLMAILCIPNLH